ncbi:hypothetical protein BIW11_01213 [Tropilaelaps mercedesae]|uniref:Uncharacterized protein n=1 Tax=Tropilaelaps mercedesae TaxID=418985 RepID=A0A1V9XHV1_9ACAR|nr:hypothetical protein BIW11_01213 [Tropilaelaps mercedesae]
MAEISEVHPGTRAPQATSPQPNANATTTSHTAETTRSAFGVRDISTVATNSTSTGSASATSTTSVTVPSLQQLLAVLAGGADPAVTVAQVTARLAPGGTTLSTRVARLRPILPKPALHAHKTDPLNLKSVCLQLAPGSVSGGTLAATGSSLPTPSGNSPTDGIAARISALNYPTPSTLSSCSSPTQSQLSDFDIPSPLSISDRSTPLDFSPAVDIASTRSDNVPRELTPKNSSERTRTQSTNHNNNSHKHLLGDRASGFMPIGFSVNAASQSSASSTLSSVPDQFLATRASPEFIAETPITLNTNHTPGPIDSNRTAAQPGHGHVNLDELRYAPIGEVLSTRTSPPGASANSSVTLRGGLHTPPPSECAVEAQTLGQPQMLSSRSHSLHSLNFQPSAGHIEAPPGFESLLCTTPGPAEHSNAGGCPGHGSPATPPSDGSNILQNAIFLSQLNI